LRPQNTVNSSRIFVVQTKEKFKICTIENIQAVEDPALDDILSNLQDSLSGLGGLDDYDFAPQPVAGGNKFSNNNSSSSNNNNSTAGGDSDFGFDTSATCVSCYGSIEGTVIKAFEKTYHPHCFYW